MSYICNVVNKFKSKYKNNYGNEGIKKRKSSPKQNV